MLQQGSGMPVTENEKEKNEQPLAIKCVWHRQVYNLSSFSFVLKLLKLLFVTHRGVERTFVHVGWTKYFSENNSVTGLFRQVVAP